MRRALAVMSCVLPMLFSPALPALAQDDSAPLIAAQKQGLTALDYPD